MKEWMSGNRVRLAVEFCGFLFSLLLYMHGHGIQFPIKLLIMSLLLIAACLSKMEVKQLAATAKDIGMEVLLEIHNATELEHICDDVDMVEINRNQQFNIEALA